MRNLVFKFGKGIISPEIKQHCLVTKCLKKHYKNYSKVKSTEGKFKVPNILLIEDDYIAQTVNSILLKDCIKCDLTVASTGQQALDYFGDSSLIFLDIDLPDINGIDICKIIRHTSQNVPIIALTSYCNMMQRCFDAGVNDFIDKPVNISKLLDLLYKWLPSYRVNIKKDFLKSIESNESK